MFRLISWNVAGRVKKLAAQINGLAEYKSDVTALQEVTATTIPLWRRELEERDYQVVTSLDVAHNREELVGERKYEVLTAEHRPVELLSPADFGAPWPERVLSVTFNSPWGEAECHNAHLPAGVSHGWIKVETFEGVYERLCRASEHPRILCDDFNSPKEEFSDGATIPFNTNNERWSKAEPSVIRGLEECDLGDVYRVLHGFEKQEMSWVTWRRGKKHGRRFDHIFASQRLNTITCSYVHSLREQGLSDHAPIEACFEPEKKAA